MKREKVHKVEGHKCALPLIEKLIILYISEGAFVNFRRKFRSFFMINPSYPESKSVFKSTSRIRWEEARHLRKHYYMIHPFSEGRVTWEIIMIATYLMLFIMMPVEMILLQAPFIILYGVGFFCVLCLMDVIFHFCTGYYDITSRKVILNPRKVFVHYILRMFVLDVLSSIPYNIVINYTERYDLYYLKYLYFFKILRLPTLLQYMKKYCLRLEIWNFYLSFVGVIIFLLIIIWWATTYAYIIYLSSISNDDAVQELRRMVGKDALTPLMECCLDVVRTVTLVRISEIHNDSITVQLFYICLLVGGVALNFIMFIQVMKIYKRNSSSKNQYSNLTREISEYMNYKKVPANTQKRIFRYIEFKFQKNIFRESDILQTLSKPLQKDIQLHSCRRLLERVDFFKCLPSNIIMEIVNKLRPEIFLPTDVIVTYGSVSSSMYFIYAGAVAVYSAMNTEICHLNDGSHFGEIALLINEPRVASVVAITTCEIYRLHRKEFLDVLDPYPSLYNEFKRIALKRLHATRHLMETDSMQGKDSNAEH